MKKNSMPWNSLMKTLFEMNTWFLFYANLPPFYYPQQPRRGSWGNQLADLLTSRLEMVVIPTTCFPCAVSIFFSSPWIIPFGRNTLLATNYNNNQWYPFSFSSHEFQAPPDIIWLISGIAREAGCGGESEFSHLHKENATGPQDLVWGSDRDPLSLLSALVQKCCHFPLSEEGERFFFSV